MIYWFKYHAAIHKILVDNWDKNISFNFIVKTSLWVCNEINLFQKQRMHNNLIRYLIKMSLLNMSIVCAYLNYDWFVVVVFWTFNIFTFEEHYHIFCACARVIILLHMRRVSIIKDSDKHMGIVKRILWFDEKYEKK